MMTHCNNMHKTLGIKCDVQDCQVRVDTQRAKQLHIHSLHPDFKVSNCYSVLTQLY
jgi:hypothetical protein